MPGSVPEARAGRNGLGGAEGVGLDLAVSEAYPSVMLIGVSGPNGAGKGEVVRYLEERSFSAHSLSDTLREELRRRGLPESRERMIELGNEWRAANGPGALAERLVAELAPDRNYVVDSIRHPAEVEALRRGRRDFHLLWVDADIALRFERLRARGRPGDPNTLAELRELEGRELGSADPAAQQLLAVKERADFRVENAGSREDLHAAVQQLLERTQRFERPGWDDYFMDIARMVAARSNCVKRKVGAVVVVERRIISTGYNGTPRGVRNCNEGGCPRCNSFAPGGTRLDECLCSHGEENAITQAAYHGVSLKGATLYTTFSPCLMCTKMIINAGAAEVVYNVDYPMAEVPLGLLREAGVKVRQIGVAD
ncbi:MAG: deaminase [Proteobacteria bacterium]|nr:deaminase [Pseudomonadota bacterium]